MDLMVAELRAMWEFSICSVQCSESADRDVSTWRTNTIRTQLVFGDEGEFRMAFGNGSVERGEFAAALIATHGYQ